MCSCTETNNCGENEPYFDQSIRVKLLDAKTGNDLIDYDGKYNPSKVEVYVNGKKDKIIISSRLDIDDWIFPYAYDTTYELQYLINLYDWDDKLNQDTIILRYEVGRLQCYDDIEYMALWYNDSLFYSGEETFYLYFRF